MKNEQVKKEQEKGEQIERVTFLGPIGATFSHDTYNVLAKMYGAPKVTKTNYVPAGTNEEVLKLIRQHGGYGAIDMETLAECRVNESSESFIELLTSYMKLDECPFRVIGAVKLKLHFCLMVRQDVNESMITKIVAHKKALGACKERIAKIMLPTADAPSNGEAARRVAESEEYATYAALGTRSAADKYGLKVLCEAFEDREAVTTFFLIAPSSHGMSVGKENRALIVFKVPHKPGALVKSLLPFEQENLNLIQIHSAQTGNHTYNFAIEIEVKESELEAFGRAMEMFMQHVDIYLSFGPFQVLSR